MPDWPSLHHAYGSAGDVPAFLNAIVPDPQAEVWDDLWSRLCHQGTVYSASFAALPFLADIAGTWSPVDRMPILSLAGQIVASNDVAGNRAEMTRGLDPALHALENLALESLPAASNAEAFVYVLQSILGLRCVTPWARCIDHVLGEEFQVICPQCDAELFLVMGAVDRFATSDDPIYGPTEKRSPIRLPDRALTPDEQWILDACDKGGYPLLTRSLHHAFGSTRCPDCGAAIDIPTLLW